MKKLNVVIITVIFALCYNTTTYASTTIKSSLEENDDMIQMLNIPSPVDVFTTSFGFFGTFIKGFLIVILFYTFATFICKILINSTKSLKTYFSHKKLGKIMDRMYEYKREV